MNEPKILDILKPLEVSYCIPLWLRDEHVKYAISRIKERIKPSYELRSDAIAVVCFGPSLNDTWEQLKNFKYIITCSGAHKFLVDKGIKATWHVEVDPRSHKVQLIGQPQKETEYLIASTCHKAVFDHLEGHNVKLWHVFANEEDALRTLPHGEWALTGGSSVGLRCLTIARFLGFTDIHIFGMDGSEGSSGKHADIHPNQPKGHNLVEYPPKSNIMWKTTPSMLECARQTWHELNQMPDVKTTFYGEGLVQAMAKHYKPNLVEKDAIIGFSKPSLISDEYKKLNTQLHQNNMAYGVGGGKYAEIVLKLIQSLRDSTKELNISVLDYGAGKGYLAKELAKFKIPIWEYDPAVPGKDESPRVADLVVCTDVLEHIEPEKLLFVLDDLKRCVKQIGFFTIHTGPAIKTLPDGRNTHLIQQKEPWWREQLEQFFIVGKIITKGPELHVIVGPKDNKKNKLAPWKI